MSGLSCTIAHLLIQLVQLYVLVLIVYALLSWVPDLRGRWTIYLARLVDPVLAPVRRVIPPMGGLDLSFIVVFLVIEFVVVPLLGSVATHACYPGL
ncbi:MAG TPA: YggT family protein [Candidatus Baltobacteraceae bacterium]